MSVKFTSHTRIPVAIIFHLFCLIHRTGKAIENYGSVPGAQEKQTWRRKRGTCRYRERPAKATAKLCKLVDWQPMTVPPQLWHADILASTSSSLPGFAFFHLLSYLSLSHSYTRSLFFPYCMRVSKCQFLCDRMWQGPLPGGTAGNRGPHKLILILFQIIQSV